MKYCCTVKYNRYFIWFVHIDNVMVRCVYLVNCDAVDASFFDSFLAQLWSTYSLIYGLHISLKVWIFEKLFSDDISLLTARSLLHGKAVFSFLDNNLILKRLFFNKVLVSRIFKALLWLASTLNLRVSEEYEKSLFSHSFPVLCKFTLPIFWELYEFLLHPKYLRNINLKCLCFPILFPYYGNPLFCLGN